MAEGHGFGGRLSDFPKGIRQRLRIAIKQAGRTEKFSTDLHRNKSLVVVGISADERTFDTFEGFDVIWIKRV